MCCQIVAISEKAFSIFYRFLSIRRFPENSNQTKFLSLKHRESNMKSLTTRPGQAYVADGKFDTLGVDYLDENEVYRAEIFFSGGVPWVLSLVKISTHSVQNSLSTDQNSARRNRRKKWTRIFKACRNFFFTLKIDVWWNNDPHRKCREMLGLSNGTIGLTKYVISVR